MNVIKLSHWVTIQQRVGTVDSIGQPTETWTDLYSLFADVRHMRGMEALRAGAETSVVKASIRVRYRSGITNGMRVVWRNFVYNILSVLPQGERNQLLDLTCERVSDTPLGD